MSMRSIDVKVRHDGHAYRASGGGRRASCAWSDARAVRLVAQKLGFNKTLDVVRVTSEGGVATWTVIEVQPSPTPKQR